MLNRKALLSLLLVFVLVFSLIGCSKAPAPANQDSNAQTEQNTDADKSSEEQSQQQEEQKEEVGYAHPDSLISATELNEIKDNVVIVDYRDAKLPGGYIPGAIAIKRADVTAEVNGVPGMLANKEQIEATFSNAGIKNDDTIIIYDDENELWAARLWWVLKVYGHENVKLLNGGLAAWKAAGFETVASAATREASTYVAKDANTQLIADIELVKSSFENDNLVVLDTRGEKEWKDGHVPGAVWIEWTNALNEDGTFKSAAELKELYESKGITPDKEAIMPHCKSAVRSSHTMFVLQELLGYDNIRNYDGSWLEYEKSGLEIEK